MTSHSNPPRPKLCFCQIQDLGSNCGVLGPSSKSRVSYAPRGQRTASERPRPLSARPVVHASTILSLCREICRSRTCFRSETMHDVSSGITGACGGRRGRCLRIGDGGGDSSVVIASSPTSGNTGGAFCSNASAGGEPASGLPHRLTGSSMSLLALSAWRGGPGRVNKGRSMRPARRPAPAIRIS